MNIIEHHFYRESAVHRLLEEAACSALRLTGTAANHVKSGSSPDESGESLVSGLWWVYGECPGFEQVGISRLWWWGSGLLSVWGQQTKNGTDKFWSLEACQRDKNCFPSPGQLTLEQIHKKLQLAFTLVMCVVLCNISKQGLCKIHQSKPTKLWLTSYARDVRVSEEHSQLWYVRGADGNRAAFPGVPFCAVTPVCRKCIELVFCPSFEEKLLGREDSWTTVFIK